MFARTLSFLMLKKKDETTIAKPITQQIFEDRLHLSRLLVEAGEQEDIELSHKLRDILHYAIANLDRSRFQVAMQLKHVEEFEDRNRWNNIDSNDVHIIEEYLSDLPVTETINESARRFDLMMLKLQIATLMTNNFKVKYEDALVEISEGLSKKYTIPAVLRAKGLIEDIKRPEFFKEISQKKLDEM